MVDIVDPYELISVSKFQTKTQDGDDLYIEAGYVKFDIKGRSGGRWNNMDLRFWVGPEWKRNPKVVPTVSLAGILNDKVANDAAWAIDDCITEFSVQGSQVIRCQLVCRVGVRDVDGYLRRVSYHVAMLGESA